jgi:nitroreductase
MTSKPEEMTLFEAIYTTRGIRKFKPDPVSDDVLKNVLEAAVQAPSGGNRQPWRFIVIRTPEGKRKVSELAVKAARAQASMTGRGDAGNIEFQESLSGVPVIIIACALRSPMPAPSDVGPHGRTFPAVQNLLLAARAHGLGGIITTGFRYAEDEFKEALHIPDDVDSTTLIPLGYPAGDAPDERHGRKTRKPIKEVFFGESWGAPLDL